MNIRIFGALCAFSSFLFIGCVANTGNAEPQTTEQAAAEQPTPDIPETPGNPSTPPQNTPPSQPEPEDKFVSLDGIDDFLSHTGNLVAGQAAHTVEFFVKFDQVADTDLGQALYSFTDSLGLVSGAVQSKFLNSQSLRGIMNGGGNGAGVVLEANQWYHIAFSFWNNNGAYRIALYLNGVRQFTGGGSRAFLSYSDSFEIGRPFAVMGGNTAFLKGSVDGVRISHGVRYGTDTITVPNRKNMNADGSTIAVWNFNETATDGKYYDTVAQKLLVKKDVVVQ